MKMNRISSSMKSFSDTKLCSHSSLDEGKKKTELVTGRGQPTLPSNHYIHGDRQDLRNKL